jgi:hypothetical protein
MESLGNPSCQNRDHNFLSFRSTVLLAHSFYAHKKRQVADFDGLEWKKLLESLWPRYTATFTRIRNNIVEHKTLIDRQLSILALTEARERWNETLKHQQEQRDRSELAEKHHREQLDRSERAEKHH